MTDEDQIEEGLLVENDLIAMITPDGRFHFGKLVSIAPGGEHQHFIICHAHCRADKEQWTLERRAHQPDEEEVA